MVIRLTRSYFVFVFAISGIFISCEQSVEPGPVSSESCMKNPKKYASNVKSIIDAKCVVCHSPSGSYPSVPLTSYKEVRFATDSGRLIGTIKHQTGFPAMPLGAPKLTENEISVIDCWKSSGYPE